MFLKAEKKEEKYTKMLFICNNKLSFAIIKIYKINCLLGQPVHD